MPISLEQYAKLPKYVQRELDRLERNEKRLREQLVQVEDSETNVALDEFEGPRYLPRNSRVLFTVGNERIAARIVNYDGQEQLSLYVGDGYLSIHPQSSNVVTAIVRGRG